MEIIYNSEDRTFSKASSFDAALKLSKGISKGLQNKSGLKLLTMMIGPALAIRTLRCATKVLMNSYAIRNRDLAISERNNKIEKLQANYESGKIKADPAKASEYKKVLHELYSQTLKTYNFENRRIKSSDATVFSNYIAPLVSLLSLLVIREVVILTGDSSARDRRYFEIVFNPEMMDPRDVAKDPFRTVVFKYKWPAHDFKIQSIGADEANGLINDTINFLANNPKFLSIRL